MNYCRTYVKEAGTQTREGKGGGGDTVLVDPAGNGGKGGGGDAVVVDPAGNGGICWQRFVTRVCYRAAVSLGFFCAQVCIYSLRTGCMHSSVRSLVERPC